MKSIITISVLLFVMLTRSICAPGRLGTVEQYLLGLTESDDQSYDATTAPVSEPDDKSTEYYTLDYGDSSEIPLELYNYTVNIDSFTEKIGATVDQYV